MFRTSKAAALKAPVASPARLPDPVGSLLMLTKVYQGHRTETRAGIYRGELDKQIDIALAGREGVASGDTIGMLNAFMAIQGFRLYSHNRHFNTFASWSWQFQTS